MLIFRKKDNTSIELPVSVQDLALRSDGEDRKSIYFCMSAVGHASEYPMFVPEVTLHLSGITKMICTLAQRSEGERSFWVLSLHLSDAETRMTIGSGSQPAFDCDLNTVDFDNFLLFGKKTVTIETKEQSIALSCSEITPVMVDESYVEFTEKKQIEKEQMIGNAVAHVANLSFTNTTSSDNLCGTTKACSLDFLIDSGRDAKQYAARLIELLTGTEVERVRITDEEYLDLFR